MYLQKCFIRKYTDEIGEKLYEMTGGKTGAVLIRPDYDDAITAIDGNNNYWNIYNRPNSCYSDDGKNLVDILLDMGFIDCGTNEQIFFAIAALRDDSDKYQWFVMDVDVYSEINKGDWFKATDREGGFHVGTQIEPLYCHKATVEELIEHFKDK